ncbi:hypothetical protein PoB_004497400, partial [Plakobranchus ocellatus]
MFQHHRPSKPWILGVIDLEIGEEAIHQPMFQHNILSKQWILGIIALEVSKKAIHQPMFQHHRLKAGDTWGHRFRG